MGAMHMALLEPEGARDLALRNLAARQVLEEGIDSIAGIDQYQPIFSNS